MAVVIGTNLRKEIAGSLLFDGVSFKVERRNRLSLSGPNGAGKTTLLRILAGETDLHGGELAFEKGARIALHDTPAAGESRREGRAERVVPLGGHGPGDVARGRAGRASERSSTQWRSSIVTSAGSSARRAL